MSRRDHLSFKKSSLKLESLESRLLFTLGNPLLLPDDGTISPAAGTQYEPQISRGANHSLVVWTDNRSSLADAPLSYTKFAEKLGSMHDIYAARLDASGTVVDTTPIIISQTQHYQTWPYVAWNGSNWLVAWTTERENNPYAVDLLAIRVSPDGSILDPTPITVYSGGTSLETHTWSVTSDGTNWVVLWTGWTPGFSVRAVQAARVDPSGAVLDPGGKFVRTIPQGFFWGADIAFAGDEYLVTWREDVTQYQVRGQRLSMKLDPVGPLFTVGTATQYDVTKVASDGNSYFVVAAGDSVFSSARGTRVSHDGQVQDPGWLTIAPSAIAVDVVWDGTNWLTAYSKGVSFSEYDIYGSRITSNGAILDPNGFVIDQGVGFQSQPAITSGLSGKAQVVWRDLDSSPATRSDIMTARIAGDYSVNQPVVVDLGEPRQSAPRMASNGNGFLAVFHSETSGESRVLAQRLDSAGNPAGSPILVGAELARNPSVAWNGSLYLIVWQGPGSGLNQQIFARRMLADGTLVDAAPIAVLSGQNPDVAAVGDTFLVTDIFRQTTQIQYVLAQRVSGLGALVGSSITVGFSFTRHQRVTAFADRWLVVRQQHPTHDNPSASVYAELVDVNGAVGPSMFVATGRAPHAVVGNGTALIAFDNSGNILGRRMTNEGAFVGFTSTISGAAGTQHFANVAWNGTMYVVTWLDHRNEDFPNQWRGDVYATRVSPNGRILDRPGFAVANSPAPEDTPSIIGANGVTIFAYAAFYDAPFANMRVTLRTLVGAPSAPDGLPSFGGNDVAYVWSSNSPIVAQDSKHSQVLPESASLPKNIPTNRYAGLRRALAIVDPGQLVLQE